MFAMINFLSNTRPLQPLIIATTHEEFLAAFDEDSSDVVGAQGGPVLAKAKPS